MTDPFNAVIFDMDGLLVDSEPVWATCERELLAKRGKAWRFEVQQKLIGMRMDDFLSGMIAGYALGEAPHVMREELLTEMRARIPVHAHARPGAAELLAYLHEAGIPCAIASSSAEVIIDTVVQSRGWDRYFQTRVTAEVVQHGKPAPDVYLEAARQLGVDPRDCLALEDSPNGARAAVAAGMTCYAVPDASHAHAELFDGITPHVFDSLHDVLRELEGSRFED